MIAPCRDAINTLARSEDLKVRGSTFLGRVFLIPLPPPAIIAECKTSNFARNNIAVETRYLS